MAEKEIKKPVKKIDKKVEKEEKKIKQVKPVKEKKVKPAKVKPVKVKETKETPEVEVEKKIIGGGKIIHLKPMVTEKAVMLIESQNVMTFETTMDIRRDQIKEEVEEIFETKVDNVRTLIRKSKKYAYVKLNPKTPAIDIATKLGMI